MNWSILGDAAAAGFVYGITPGPGVLALLGPGTAGQPVADLSDVVDVAVAPRGAALAVVQGADRQRLLTGPLAGPLVERPGLGRVTSPSWGSGEHGVWLLRTGDDPALLVLPHGVRCLDARLRLAAPSLPPRLTRSLRPAPAEDAVRRPGRPSGTGPGPAPLSAPDGPVHPGSQEGP